MVVPGLIFFGGAKVALRFPCAGARSVPLLAILPATSATVGPLAVRRHEAKAKAAITSIYLHLLADPAGDPSDFDVGCLEYLTSFERFSERHVTVKYWGVEGSVELEIREMLNLV